MCAVYDPKRFWSEVTVTVFKTSRHSKLLFFVKKTKDKGTQKAVQMYGIGKLLCEKNYGTFGVEMRAYGQKLVRNWSNFAHTQVRVTVFKTSRQSKLMFFVKNKGQWKAKSGPKVGDGKVAM